MPQKPKPSLDDLAANVRELLREFGIPLRWKDSPWLDSCCVSHEIDTNNLLPRDALRQILLASLEVLQKEDEQSYVILQLRFLDRMTIIELSHRLNLEERSVYSRQRKAIQVLVEILIDKEISCRASYSNDLNNGSVVCNLCGQIAGNETHLFEIKQGLYICAECVSDSIEGFHQSGISVRVTRAIEFSPEYFQAGVSILNYFGTVLREKHDHLHAKVRIEQDGLKVTLIVESENGEREEIEQALNEYSLLISGEISPEKFYKDNPLKVIELKQQLQMAQVQIETQKQILALTNYYHEKHVITLEDEVKSLRSQVGVALTRAVATHIAQVTGDIIASDKVSVGDITGSTGIAVGKNIKADTNLDKS